LDVRAFAKASVVVALCLAVGVFAALGEHNRAEAAPSATVNFSPNPAFAAINATQFTVSIRANNVTTLYNDTAESGAQCNNSTDDDGDTRVNEGCPASQTAETASKCTDAADDDGDTKVNDGCPQANPEPESIVCADSNDQDTDGAVNDGCPANGAPEVNCGGTIDDDADSFINDGCPIVGIEAEFVAVCTNTTDNDGDGIINDGCPASGAPESGGQCNNTLDEDSDGRPNDGCPAGGSRPEAGGECNDAIDNDGDAHTNDGCPTTGAAESACTNAIDDDGDPMVNDGCPAVGGAESGTQCLDESDSDGDSRVNDGCPIVPEPEVICTGAVDDDDDGLVNDGCPVEQNCSSTLPGQPGNEPCGLGAFQVTLNWDYVKLNYVNHSVGPFLTSTGRSLNPCSFFSGLGTITYICSTTGAVPLGPEGSGTLMSVVFQPVTANVNLNESIPVTQVTQLADITGRIIPSTTPAGAVVIRRCADVSGNGTVSLADVLETLGHVGETPASPGWNPKYDLNQNANVTLSDALYALAEVGQSCTFIP